MLYASAYYIKMYSGLHFHGSKHYESRSDCIRQVGLGVKMLHAF